jgi:hypothetical protein
MIAGDGKWYFSIYHHQTYAVVYQHDNKKSDTFIFSHPKIHSVVCNAWKIQSELTPRANVSLTPENFLILTP